MTDMIQAILIMRICWGIILFMIVANVIVISNWLPTIKMNHLAGFRFKQAFYSDENWYKINTYGCMVFKKWAILAAIAGIFLILVPLDDVILVNVVFFAVLALIAIPFYMAYAYAKQFERPTII